MDIISKDMLKEFKGHKINTSVSGAKQRILQGHIRDIQDNDWTIYRTKHKQHTSMDKTHFGTRIKTIYRTPQIGVDRGQGK